jgi:stage V sporulation protein R
MNEGWSSYWHETLFLQDDRISGHEVEFARVNSGVTSMPRVGLNPYALGMRLFYYLEEMSDKGRYSIEFQKLTDADSRKDFDEKTGNGKDFIYSIREDFCDFTFINTFVDQDFIDRNKLFVAGKRLSENKMSWEYYVKSRKVEDYRRMIMEGLYHPPHIEVSENKGDDDTLYLLHHFEEKPLVEEFVSNTMLGIEYLWGGPVQLETSEVESIKPVKQTDSKTGSALSKEDNSEEHEVKWRRVLYTMKDRKLSKKTI